MIQHLPCRLCTYHKSIFTFPALIPWILPRFYVLKAAYALFFDKDDQSYPCHMGAYTLALEAIMRLHNVAVHFVHPAAFEVDADALVMEKGNVSTVHLAAYQLMPFPLHPVLKDFVLADLVAGIVNEYHN